MAKPATNCAPDPSLPDARRPGRRRRPIRLLLLALLAGWVATGLWHSFKPLPDGVNVTGGFIATPDDSLQLLTDLTWLDAQGRRAHHREIHAAVLQLVHDARDFLVLDYFLFNGQGGPAGPLQHADGIEPVAAQLLAALRELKTAQPQLPVLVMVDPINDYYRGTPPPGLAALEALGIDVVVTRLDRLRDSNPVYSGAWRLLAGWWLDPRGAGRWPNLLDAAGPRLPAGALLRLPNFKANHRKVALTGDGEGSLLGIVSSANPHDASSAHSNIALRVHGEALRPLLDSELAIARWSGWAGAGWPSLAATDGPVPPTGETRTAIVTEGAIRDALLARLDAAGRGDAIDIAQFYFSERAVIRALVDAAQRGATVRVLLDPNKDAFGFEKSGIPNRQVARELLESTNGALQLRWIRTHGEQFHAKLAAVRAGDRLWFTLGSANFTRRNIGNYNLEANAIVETPFGSPISGQVDHWFGTLWNNPQTGIEYSSDAVTYAEDSIVRYGLYRFMEASGMSTF